MNEETIGVLLAGAALLAFLWYTRGNSTTQAIPQGSTVPTASSLAAAVSPSDFDSGPTYFIANQPYYFAPPVANMMQQATASNTIATNEDGGCGCN